MTVRSGVAGALVLTGILLPLLFCIPAGADPLPGYNFIHFHVSNDAGVKYDAFGNDTYYVKFEGPGRGQNAVHISTDLSAPSGQVTVTGDQAGFFYATDTGGKHYEDDVILLVAVNGTIPENFALHVRSSGADWPPVYAPPGSNAALPDPSTVQYVAGAVNETFTKADFQYGPQIWRPSGDADNPLYDGQDMANTTNTFQLLFIDTNVGLLPNFGGLPDNGMVKIEYSFEHLHTFAALNVYGWCSSSNNGYNMTAWTNRLIGGSGYSGYSVVGTPETPDPSPSFTMNVTTGSAPLAVLFNDTTAGDGIVGYRWVFSDDPFAVYTSRNVTHTFPAPGTYEVSHAITAGGTVWTNLTSCITVTSLPAPVPGFTAEPLSGTAPLFVNFTDTSAGEGITGYQWIFSDDPGTVCSGRNVTHTFAAPGTYSVNHSVTNGTITVWKNETGYITVFNDPPVPDFTGLPQAGTAPLEVQFNDTSTGNGSISYQWILGDDPGTVFTGRNLTHTFTAAGVYSVNHSAANDGGTAWLNRTGYITVHNAPPVTNFTASPLTGEAPLTVLFNDTSTGSAITAYRWIFPDDPGTVFTDRNLTHTFTDPGIYTVNHSASNDGGTVWKNSTGLILVRRTPVITALQPKKRASGSGAFVLTVKGTGFDSTSIVQWKGANRTTTYVSPMQVKAKITAKDVKKAGKRTVRVLNPGPCGGLSNGKVFTIT